MRALDVRLKAAAGLSSSKHAELSHLQGAKRKHMIVVPPCGHGKIWCEVVLC
jgi:hypothetical protein